MSEAAAALAAKGMSAAASWHTHLEALLGAIPCRARLEFSHLSRAVRFCLAADVAEDALPAL